jgi:hypothetical protein
MLSIITTKLIGKSSLCEGLIILLNDFRAYRGVQIENANNFRQNILVS